MQPSDDLIKRGVTALPTVGDGRQSGTSASASILNASPEAVVGGNLSILQTNDTVRIDLNTRTVNVLVSDAEIEQRKAELPPIELVHQTPWQELYRQEVGQLETGGCLEFAVKYQQILQTYGNPRHSH
jgi:dihydroxyacid dehydratase/phosphogluconate dehydratase